MTLSLSSRQIRERRPPREAVDRALPAGVFWEDERISGGGVVPVLTVLLTGAECRFTCVFCDLWRGTLAGPTPAGAIPAQIRDTVHRAGALPPRAAIKLYNHSNYFDRRAVPPEDDAAVLALVAPFSRVTVECHPTLIDQRCFEFGERLDGALEVALGLETADARVLERLNKDMTLEDFAGAAGRLRDRAIGIRAFVLVSPPFVAPADIVQSAVQSAEFAFAHGAQHVSLIPVRGGNGVMEDLVRSGAFVPPTLAQVEEALESCLSLGGGVVTADLWEAERLATCRQCGPARLARLERINRSGRSEPTVSCTACPPA